MDELTNPAWWMVGFALIGAIGGIVGSWVTVRILLAVLRRDIEHLSEKLKEAVSALTGSMNEARVDRGVIFERLAKLEQRVARIEGRERLKGDD